MFFEIYVLSITKSTYYLAISILHIYTILFILTIARITSITICAAISLLIRNIESNSFSLIWKKSSSRSCQYNYNIYIYPHCWVNNIIISIRNASMRALHHAIAIHICVHTSVIFQMIRWKSKTSQVSYGIPNWKLKRAWYREQNVPIKRAFYLHYRLSRTHTSPLNHIFVFRYADDASHAII